MLTATYSDTVGVTLYRYCEMEIDRPALPNLRGWYERLMQRPPYLDHVMIRLRSCVGNREGRFGG
jgi:glutathione S-transferase